MEITEDQFYDEFRPVQNHLRAGVDFMFETSGPDLEFVRAQPENKVWTLMDDEDGKLIIVSGLHLVKRLIGYYITDAPWTEDTTVP